MRSISDKQILSLKAATRRAVDMAGGGDAFQHATRVRAGALSKYGSPNDDNREAVMPIDVAVEADSEAGAPIILSAMAEALGYQVVARAAVESAPLGRLTVRDALQIANEAADVVKAITDALADDERIDAAEERVITREIDEALAVLTQAMKKLGAR